MSFTSKSIITRGGVLGLVALVLSACADTTDPVEDVSVTLSQALRNDSAMIAHVYYGDREKLDWLVTRYDALEHANHEEGYVDMLLSREDYIDLRQQGFRIAINDAMTAELNKPRPTGDEVSISGISGYTCYRTVEETYSSMAQIATNYPNLASWIDIGDSWEKVTPGGKAGYDMHVLILTNKSTPGPKPRFFLMGAIHAREYTTAETAARFAEHLVNNYNTNADVNWLLNNFEAHILFQSNPDGRKIAELGYYQRKNTNNTNGGSCSNPPTSSNQYGTDLNRNSSWYWGGGGTSTYPCDQTYRGPSAASEPETQAIQNYIASIFPDQRGSLSTDPAPVTTTGVMITLHSYGNYVLFPWGATSTAAPNKTHLQTLARKFNYFNGYLAGQTSTTLYTASGSTDEYAYGALGIAAYTFELGSAFFQSCTTFTGTIYPQNLPALLYAFKAARRPYQNPAGPDSVSVALSASSVPAGSLVTLTATASDTRYGTNGGTEASQAIVAARYTVDKPSWAGATTFAMSASDGAFSSTVEGIRATINTAGWAPGRHTIFVESQDSAGNWGVPTAVFLTIQ